MEHPNAQNLKYGVIYIYYDPNANTLSNKRHAQSMIGKIAHPFKIEWVSEQGRGPNNTLLVARRFNVGNMGQCATVSLRTSDDNRYGAQFDALYEFRNKLFEVADTDGGDIVLDEDDFATIRRPKAYDGDVTSCCDAELPMPSAAPQDKTRVESASRRIAEKAAGWLRKRASHADVVFGTQVSECRMPRQTEPDLLQEEEKLELKRIERERKRALERIKQEIVNYIAEYHEDPTEMMAELLRGKVVVGQPGRLLVNGDLKIVLPEYDEMEIQMPAMCRTLYILFMKQRKAGEGGIVLRNIDNFRDDLIDIYGMVKPGASDDRVVRLVDNLCDPLGESLNQTISRINRCIKNVITDKELAKKYTITGTRGNLYSIQLDPDYMNLPRAI
jgi:hypothetical protein